MQQSGQCPCLVQNSGLAAATRLEPTHTCLQAEALVQPIMQQVTSTTRNCTAEGCFHLHLDTVARCHAGRRRRGRQRLRGC